MASPPIPGKVAFLGDYPPRQCGIATFTRDLRAAVAAAHPAWQCPVIAVSDRPGGYAYPAEVRFEIPQNDDASYLRAANFLRQAHLDVLCVQHEFGIFGGAAGGHLLGLLRRVRLPVVTTLHTVLAQPDPAQRRVFDELVRLSARLVVMAAHAKDMLRDLYGVAEDRVSVVPHGIPDVPFTDPGFFKDQFDVAGRPVILTFGLLSPNKGIEHAIRALPAIVERHPRVVYLVLGATHPNLLRTEGESYRRKLAHLARALGVAANVVFVNRYVPEDELRAYIGAADIYLTPYLNEAQISSGTLSYCYGAGKAVVSTPYWHAAELLAGGRGVLVPFRDPAAIAREIGDLLAQPERLKHLRKDAYLAGRGMVWSAVARDYDGIFENACLHFARHRPRGPGPMTSAPSHLPPWRPDHLLRLTDSTGLFQHAVFAVPRFAHGYCTDDNARALLLAVLLEELDELPPELARARTAYAAFLQHAFVRTTGRFRNFLGFDRRWPEAQGSEDSHGRALWALGAVAGRTRSETLRAWAAPLFEAALPVAGSFTSPRAWAFTILGLHEYLRAMDGDLLAARLRGELAARLFALWRGVATADWPWFEDIVAYDNPRLSQALILAGRWTSRHEMQEAGLQSLRWLMENQRGAGGWFRPVGSDGFWRKGGVRAGYDQQPLEAAAAVGACLEAFRTTSDPWWRAQARAAFDWFLGANDLDEPLYDASTGGCRDGLHPHRANRNQGAESTLSFWLALTELKALDNDTAAFAPAAAALATP